MNALSIRNIPQPVVKSIRRLARESHKSINKTVVELLAQGTGVQSDENPSRKKRDLGTVFTRWTREEFEEFQNHTGDFNHIDDELWR